MATEDIFEKRRKQLGLSSSGPKQDSSMDDAFTRRRMDLGLIPDTRPKSTPQLPKTQAQAHSFGNDAIDQFQGKLPVASLLTVGTGGPSHASQITGNTRFDQNHREIEDSKAPAIVKSYANVMNNLVEGNPVGRFLSRALPSDPTVQQDSTGNKTADRVAGFLKQNVTPILTPTGAPIGQGIIGGSYDAAGKALSKGIGQKAVNAAANLIPRASASTAQNIARVGLTEGIAGAAQGVGLGLQNGQDSGREILANAGLGAAGGLVLGAGGAALGEAGRTVLGRLRPASNAVEETVQPTVRPMERTTPNVNETTTIPSPIRQEQPARTPVMDREPVNPIVPARQQTPREAEIMRKLDNHEPMSQDDIDYMLQVSNEPDNVVQPKPDNVVEFPESPRTKERGFYQTLKESEKVPETVNRMKGEYEPITNQETLDKANRNIAQDINKAKNDVLDPGKKVANAESIATAQRLIQEYTKIGDHETAALIAEKAASDLTNAGQTIQAASMWNRLSPEGMLLRVQRKVAQINETLSPLEEKVTLEPAVAAKITETGTAMQKAQNVRDLAAEVTDMIAKKEPGTPLTAEEKALLTEFEKQVKDVNNSVKPFLRQEKNAAKREIEKIAKTNPQERTRDQVVKYLDAKAAEALERRKRSRNVGIVAELNNPVVDYAIIAASKIARGIRDFSDLTEDMVKSIGPEYRKHADEVFVKATNIYRKEQGIPTTTELERVIKHASHEFDAETANTLRRMAAEIGYYTDDNIKRELTQDLQEIVKTFGKSTLGEKISAVQTSAQLLSAPTFLRNALGNAGQMALEKVNKISAVPIDWALSKLTGERTIQFLPDNQERFWKNFASGTKSGWRGVNAMGTLDSYDVHPNVFGENNPLRYLVKATGASLQGMDYAAYKAAYGDVMATYAEQLGKSKGMSKAQIKENMPELLTQLDERVRELADKAGKYATYQDETLLSKAAQGVKKALNASTDKLAKAAVEKGLLPKSLSTEGFGLGDVVLKYAKTPANLVMRGIDYSPLGFIRSVGELMPLVSNRAKFNQFEATRVLSRAITGTLGLSALGYTMADAGLLTGAASSDIDKRSLEEQSGKGAYKMNLSGIKRWVMSGFDKSQAQFKPGDTIIDYAWIQPAAISLGMGVNFKQALQQPDKTNTELAKDSILGGLRTVLENPMVTGLSDVIGGISDVINRQDTKKLKGIVKGIPASFVPSVVGQARTATDNMQRETYDANLFKEMMNIVQNKVPVLSKKLPISYNSLGTPRERIQNGQANTLGQYLNSFLNPSKLTQYEVSPEAKTVLDILNDSNDSGVLPRIAQKYIMVTDPVTKQQKKVDLTKEQFSRLQKEMGQRVAEKIRDKQGYLTDPNRAIDKKAKKLKDILEKIGSDVRNEFREEMGYAKKR
ncbi:hypothetical protein [Paenibacillus sabinae]|uniref:Large polyvalent protein associated domain-containing protein n=1 Tax=Paenibacillus sabinae T27 TaxID=1268072 RepID=X4ZHF1_9BACL|nr:hypothetical protein [Paenibacillus sabinae]AHV96160.1 hypothetical protein PSAB_06120 [Paenibacillus sabinae T27]